MYAVYFYLRYDASYCDLEAIMAECGVNLDYATLNRWVSRYASLVAEAAGYRKCATDRSWRMDETYVKVKGSGFTSIALSTNTARHWTSCYPIVETRLLRRGSSPARSRRTGCRLKLSSTRAEQIQLGSRRSTRCSKALGALYRSSWFERNISIISSNRITGLSDVESVQRWDSNLSLQPHLSLQA